MKLKSLTPQQTSSYGRMYIKPNPPTPEAVKRAQFVDKTYVWHRK
jgi:hypothetical protein